MEVNVLNIKGEDTGRKVTLNESIFGIEPNAMMYLILPAKKKSAITAF